MLGEHFLLLPLNFAKIPIICYGFSYLKLLCSSKYFSIQCFAILYSKLKICVEARFFLNYYWNTKFSKGSSDLKIFVFQSVRFVKAWIFLISVYRVNSPSIYIHTCERTYCALFTKAIWFLLSFDLSNTIQKNLFCKAWYCNERSLLDQMLFLI